VLYDDEQRLQEGNKESPVKVFKDRVK
jgi:hypothetical protein